MDTEELIVLIMAFQNVERMEIRKDEGYPYAGAAYVYVDAVLVNGEAHQYYGPTLHTALSGLLQTHTELQVV